MAPEMKSPGSPLQIAAARANGAKSRGPVMAEGKRASAANSANSTGPVTSEGKARSSRNATRHGLLSDSMVLHGESDARFCALLDTLENELQPTPGIESIQTEVMAIAHWRRMRLWSLEKAFYLQETLKRQDAQAGHEEGEDGEPPHHPTSPVPSAPWPTNPTLWNCSTATKLVMDANTCAPSAASTTSATAKMPGLQKHEISKRTEPGTPKQKLSQSLVE